MSWRRISPAAQARRLVGRDAEPRGAQPRTPGHRPNHSPVFGCAHGGGHHGAEDRCARGHRPRSGPTWRRSTRPSTRCGVTAPEELCDGTAHRVADGDHGAGAQVLEEGGDVVGAVGQAEASPAADATAVPAQVGGDHRIVLCEGLEGVEPVEAPAGDPAVQQHDGRRPGRSAMWRTNVVPRPASSMRSPKGSGGSGRGPRPSCAAIYDTPSGLDVHGRVRLRADDLARCCCCRCPARPGPPRCRRGPAAVLPAGSRPRR